MMNELSFRYANVARLAPVANVARLAAAAAAPAVGSFSNTKALRYSLECLACV